MFDTESGLVKIWLKQVKANPKTRDKVPALSNLREVVFELLDGDQDA